MAKCGHDILCVALNDQHIRKNQCHVRLQISNISSIPPAIRYSYSSSWASKISSLNKLTKIFKPDWVSLQYVPYSYGRRGIPMRFTFNMLTLDNSWSWHFMFHELWISSKENIRSFAISSLQRLLTKTLTIFLKPSIVHTSIDHYVALLQKIGISASILPVFSNISPPKYNLPDPINTKRWIFIFFGSFDDKWQSEPLFKYIDQARQSEGIKECHFWRIGRSSSLGDQIWKELSSAESRLLYPAFHFSNYGEQSEINISKLLLSASFGISMAPLQWIGKSGSVAAMVEHGLPVIVPTYPTTIDIPPSSSISFSMNLLSIDSSLPARLQNAVKFSTLNRLDLTASYLARLFTS